MTLLISHPYLLTERKIVNNQQLIKETVHDVNLHPTFIQSLENHLAIENVLDISYRALSTTFYFLYLHTNKGVITFHSKTNPERFVSIFRQLKAV